jgi:methylase of polypeptide subunit release factors
MVQSLVVIYLFCCQLVDYLEENYAKELQQGATVLELGAGTGVVGVSMACMGARVVLTDR